MRPAVRSQCGVGLKGAAGSIRPRRRSREPPERESASRSPEPSVGLCRETQRNARTVLPDKHRSGRCLQRRRERGAERTAARKSPIFGALLHAGGSRDAVCLAKRRARSAARVPRACRAGRRQSQPGPVRRALLRDATECPDRLPVRGRIEPAGRCCPDQQVLQETQKPRRSGSRLGGFRTMSTKQQDQRQKKNLERRRRYRRTRSEPPAFRIAASSSCPCHTEP